MTSLFDPHMYDATVNRIDGLSPSAERQRGRMSLAQMLEHSARAVEMALGRGRQKQMLLGKLIGWTVRKRFVSEEPFQKNGPTGPDFIVRDEPDFLAAKSRLVGLVRALHAMGEAGADGHMHGFFGRMSGAE